VQAALNQGVAADAILNQALIAAMNEVGKRFEEGEFFVPEMLVAARHAGKSQSAQASAHGGRHG
jgi:5-methyltetrahydrofolate--homocysteine methyltransferase